MLGVAQGCHSLLSLEIRVQSLLEQCVEEVATLSDTLQTSCEDRRVEMQNSQALLLTCHPWDHLLVHHKLQCGGLWFRWTAAATPLGGITPFSNPLPEPSNQVMRWMVSYPIPNSCFQASPLPHSTACLPFPCHTSGLIASCKLLSCRNQTWEGIREGRKQNHQRLTQ